MAKERHYSACTINTHKCECFDKLTEEEKKKLAKKKSTDDKASDKKE